MRKTKGPAVSPHWLVFIATVLFCVPTFSNELNLYVYRAPRKLVWDTPGELARSAVGNSLGPAFWGGLMAPIVNVPVERLYPHSISHIDVGLKCGSRPSVLRGITAQKTNLAYLWELATAFVSMEALITSVPGRLRKTAEIQAHLETYGPLGFIRVLKIEITDEQCQKLQSYIRVYEQTGLHRIYGGLRADPLAGQGAGCSAFAMSVLKVLDLPLDVLKPYWMRTLNIPMRLLNSKSRTADYGMWAFLSGVNSSWARPKEPSIKVSFFDPDLIYAWIGDTQAGQKTQFLPSRLEAEGSLMTLVWDARSLRTTPALPFKLTMEAITRNAVDTFLRSNQYLSEEELRNPYHVECRTFGFCG